MNREEYLAYLENQNGYCECPELAGLFEQRRKVEGLEGKCGMLKGNVDLENPRPEDRTILVDYKQSVNVLRDASDVYYEEMNGLLDQGLLATRLHHETEFIPVGYVNSQQARDLLEEKDAIVTIHCSSCEQQIDVAE